VTALANDFLCYHESAWLNNCPVDFKPVYYRRYVDDVFLLFKDQTHISQFLDYLNSKHPNIVFSSEVENDMKLSYLDVLIDRNSNQFSTSVYRKDSYSGLGTRYDSYVPNIFKSNLISCLIIRAFRICSSEIAFTKELEFLKSFLFKNMFPVDIVDKIFKSTLHNLYNPKSPPTSPAKRDLFVKIPYLGILGYRSKRWIKSLIGRYYPQINIRVIFTSKFRIQNFFKFKDKLPLSVVSSVVYQYNCGQCSATYIGETRKQLKVRICQHQMKSFRTNSMLASITPSKIAEHMINYDHQINYNSFKILSSCDNPFDQKILESIYIDRFKPNLNDHSSSVELNIVK